MKIIMRFRLLLEIESPAVQRYHNECMDMQWLGDMARQATKTAEDAKAQDKLQLHRAQIISAKSPDLWAALTKSVHDYVNGFNEAVGVDLSFRFSPGPHAVSAIRINGSSPGVKVTFEPEKQQILIAYEFSGMAAKTSTFTFKSTDTDDLFLLSNTDGEQYRDMDALAKKLLLPCFTNRVSVS